MADRDPRLQALGYLLEVYDGGRTLDQVLPNDTPPLVRELVTGTLRHTFSLGQRCDDLLSRKLRAKDNDIRYLLLLGAYQILHTRIPDHAAVSETVTCAKRLKKPWARGLINAVLRNLPEPTEEWDPAAMLDHPHWFINYTHSSLPDHWQDVLQANNTRAPMTLRVNQAKVSPEDYAARLDNENIEYRTGLTKETLQLLRPRPQQRLPGYADGEVAVQDAGAQHAAHLLAPWLRRDSQGQSPRVLDACAAPGGKGFHLQEMIPEIELFMHDNSSRRVATLRLEAERLGHTCEIHRADGTATDWWDGTGFNAILLDAPCTGSGTVRRHPDIKVLRSAKDVDTNAQLQTRLLANLWQMVVPDGCLLYCTCSLFTQENDAIIAAFIANHDDATVVPPEPQDNAVVQQHGLQLLPSADGTDGFYYSLLHKSPDAEPGATAALSSTGPAA